MTAPSDRPGRLARASASLSRGIGRLSEAGATWLLPWVLAAVAVGSTLWMRKPERLKALETNKLKHLQQIDAAVWVGSTFVVLLLVYALAVTIDRLRSGRFRYARVAGGLNRWLLFTLAAPPIGALFLKSIEKDSPKLTLFLCAAAAAIVGVATYRVASFTPPLDPVGTESVPRWRRAYHLFARISAPLAVVAMGALYGWFFSDLAITNHHALVTRTTDLGYYDNIFWQSIHGRPLSCTFIKAGYHGSAHFDPILVLLSPLYLLYPRAELLLGLQSVWLASGVVPVYLIARRYLDGRLSSLAIAACYLLHPALHGANMYEFHSLTLATVPVLWALCLLAWDRTRLYWVAVLVALLVREDIALLMCFVGLATILRQGKHRGLGAMTIVVSLVYFAVVKKYFMTSPEIFMDGKEAYSFAYYYDDMQGPDKKGMGGLVLTLITNPVFVVYHALKEAKTLFLITVFLPVLFLPLAVKRARWMLFYGLIFTLLASRAPVFSTHFQYTATILPVMFALLPEGILRVSEGRLTQLGALSAVPLRRALVAAAFVSSLLVSFKHGAIIDNQSFKGGFYRVTRTLTDAQRADHAWIEEMRGLIPDGGTVGVTNKLGPHVSGRRHAYFYGQRRTQYVLVDEKEIKGDRLQRHKKSIGEKRLIELGRRGSLALFETKNAADLDAEDAQRQKEKEQREKEQDKESPLDVMGDEPLE